MMIALKLDEMLFPKIDFQWVMQNVYRFVHLSKNNLSTTSGVTSRNGKDANLLIDTVSVLSKEILQRLSTIISQAVECIESILLTTNPTQISLSFNGGKECTVLLYLLVAVYEKHFPNRTWPIPTFFVKPDSVFIEELAFVSKCEARYHLQIEQCTGSMKSALFEYHTNHPTITTILVGTRRSDPFASELNLIQPCDPGWPSFLRVHPILDWTFHDVWLFFYSLNVEYCILYDRGYTSLGDCNYTDPNPFLKSSTSPFGYLPAWHLKDETQERAGRRTIPKPEQSSSSVSQ